VTEPRADISERSANIALAVVLLAQLALGLWGVADGWTRGHNGFNSAAYQLAARNSLRWGLLFPAQYYTGNTPPTATKLYTHAPLGLHLHNTAAVAVFGDSEATIRGVAAAMGVLAVLALFVVVRRFYGRLEAAVASAIYVALPINAIYLNMTNHVSGFVAWSLAALACYLSLVDHLEQGTGKGSTKAWLFAGLLLSQGMSMEWAWGGDIIAFVIGVAWGWSLLGRALRRSHTPRPRWAEAGWLAVFCLWVLTVFGSHFLLIYLTRDGFDEIKSVFHARQAAATWSLKSHFEMIPALMFSRSMLALGGVWLLWAAVEGLRGRAKARMLIPVSFAVTGAVFYGVFLQSAMVHSYWAWFFLPFFAIASTELVLGLARAAAGLAARVLKPSWARAGVGVVVTLACFAPFLTHAYRVIPVGRRYGGSMWFAVPERGPMPKYQSSRPELVFARFVRDATDRDVGVYLHTSFERTIPENRWFTTLDRSFKRTDKVPKAVKRRLQKKLSGGWVLVGLTRAVPQSDILRIGNAHAVDFVGPYFMVDYRKPRGVRVFDLVPGEASAAYRFFVTADEPPVSLVRNGAQERKWSERISAASELAKANPPSPAEAPSAPRAGEPKASAAATAAAPSGINRLELRPLRRPLRTDPARPGPDGGSRP
jgi:4-amino-4-deoxy-L-arabinose transferase-like glycosyltransferase